jgi:uncharacterized protein YbaR (Trm112 family)
MIREKLLEFIKCPVCLSPLALDGEEAFVCLNAACRRRYTIIDGTLPNMLEEDSTVMDEAEWKQKLDDLGAKPAEPGSAPKRRRGPKKKKPAPKSE